MRYVVVDALLVVLEVEVRRFVGSTMGGIDVNIRKRGHTI